MAINVLAHSPSITVTPHPSVRSPFVNGAKLSFTSNKIAIHGECQISGTAGDNPTGWMLGLIQLKWISTDWAFYRGQTNADGSLFEQAGRPPARAVQGCRDTITPGAIFIDNNLGKDRTVATAMSRLPFTMTAEFSDAPSRHWPLTRVNSKTRKPNFIHEAQSEAHFCTVLSLKSPLNVFHHLKCVYWNVHWQGKFLPSNFANLAAPWSIVRTGGALGNTSAVSRIIDGAPTDHRFSGLVTAAGAPHCNTLVQHALAAPNIKESHVWESFNVTR